MKLSELVAMAAEHGANDAELLIEDRHGIPRLVTQADIAWTSGEGDALILDYERED